MRGLRHAPERHAGDTGGEEQARRAALPAKGRHQQARYPAAHTGHRGGAGRRHARALPGGRGRRESEDRADAGAARGGRAAAGPGGAAKGPRGVRRRGPARAGPGGCHADEAVHRADAREAQGRDRPPGHARRQGRHPGLRRGHGQDGDRAGPVGRCRAESARGSHAGTRARCCQFAGRGAEAAAAGPAVLQRLGEAREVQQGSGHPPRRHSRWQGCAARVRGAAERPHRRPGHVTRGPSPPARRRRRRQCTRRLVQKA
mmetsp:Transcript_87734/g.228900  ORF Transcript_87734/g.228900 Transcript_87734/m.228900 type:complete len:259 (+) Transcript_87734:1965-2741(+)